MGTSKDSAEGVAAKAVRAARTRDEVRRLTRERNATQCEIEDGGDDSPEYTLNQRYPARPPTRACWARVAVDPADCDMPGPVTHEPNVEREDWCDACVRRQALHDQIKPARHKAAGAMSALMRAARRLGGPS